MSKRKQESPLRRLIKSSALWLFFFVPFVVMVSLYTRLIIPETQHHAPGQQTPLQRHAENWEKGSRILSSPIALLAFGLGAILTGPEVLRAARAYREDRRRHQLEHA